LVIVDPPASAKSARALSVLHGAEQLEALQTCSLGDSHRSSLATSAVIAITASTLTVCRAICPSCSSPSKPNPLERKQPPVLALMPRLTTTPPTRSRPARTRRHRRRILGRRQRRVPRTPVQPPLKLDHPSLEPLVRLDQLAHPQQQRDRRLPITVKDRPSLSPLHTSTFAAPTRVPPQGVNAYAFGTATNCRELQPAETGRYAHRTLTRASGLDAISAPENLARLALSHYERCRAAAGDAMESAHV